MNTDLPTYEQFMVPVLQVQSDGQVRMLREVFAAVAEHTGLSATQRAAMLPSGQPVYINRIGWAVSYLYRVGALVRPRRAHYEITDFGQQLLGRHPDGLHQKILRRYAKTGDEWWVNRRGNNAEQEESPGSTVDEPVLDPQEQVEDGINRIHSDVKADLLSRLREREPAFFERAVVRLLVAMGYGGTGGAAEVTRLVSDGGIDGVIDQDVLGLSKVYVQAKRYAADNPVLRPEVQAFVGALSGKAEQGVIITTSRFSTGAIEYAERDARVRIILIDGARLTDLMVRFGVGVQVRQEFSIVEVDEDFFE